MTIEIKLRKGEPMDRAIRRLKSAWIVKVQFAMCVKSVTLESHQIKKEARKVAAFTQMLRTVYEKM